MSWWPWTKRAKRTGAVAQTLVFRAKFDSAQTTPDNRRHWTNADHLSADAAGSANVRRILRNRARYEVANNSYARGIVLTLANDVIGTGPRLQMLAEDAGINRQIEAEFATWAKAVDLPGKLRTMRMARAQDGEVFAVLFRNNHLDSPVKLDLVLIDGSPGIGCPVIASITGTDLVLVVTEPTLSGMHNLQRVADLTKHFGIETLVCVNKWDLNEEITLQIETQALREGLTPAGRVRYDRAVTEAQIQRKSLVEYQQNGTAQEIKQLWGEVQKAIAWLNPSPTEV